MLVGPHVGDNRRGRRLVEHEHKQQHKHKVGTQLLLMLQNADPRNARYS